MSGGGGGSEMTVPMRNRLCGDDGGGVVMVW